MGAYPVLLRNKLENPGTNIVNAYLILRDMFYSVLLHVQDGAVYAARCILSVVVPWV